MLEIEGINNVVAAQALIAIILALFFDWVPKVREKWDKLPEQRMRLYMGLILFVVLLLLAFADCAFGDNCPTDWYPYIMTLFLTYAGSVTVNQGVHQIAKPPAS